MPKKQTEWSRAFNERAYDRVSIMLPKGRKEDVAAFAEERGLSVNGLINSLLYDAMGIPAEEWKSRPAEELPAPEK